MDAEKNEKAKINPNCEIRLGISSWDQNSNSVKFTSFDKNGKATRNGEIPIQALPQMVRMAIEYGYLKASEFFNG